MGTGMPARGARVNAARISRTTHKWLALIVGVQLVLWTASGSYMVVVDLDFIHGDTLIRNERPLLAAPDTLFPLADVRQQYPDVRGIVLRALPDDGAPVYDVATAGGPVLVDATSGERMSPLPEARVRALAQAYYAGSGSVVKSSLLTDDATKPSELQALPLPLWRVDFDDAFETSLYLQPETGHLVTRRHRFWRWFDFLWSLHIMDYGKRTDVNNRLLRFATLLGVTTAATGLWLVFYSFAFLQRRRRPSPAATAAGQKARRGPARA